MLRRVLRLLVLFGLVACCVSSTISRADETAAEEAPAAYRTFQELEAALTKLAESPHAELSSLAETTGGRQVHLLTLSHADGPAAADKPAVLLVGNVFAPHLLGSELATRMAQELLAESDASELLKQVTIYVVPRPTPDASEAYFAKPRDQRAGNVRATDDDRDGEVNEDPAEDLNGDGVITRMRVADPTGDYLPHPDDPRVMVKADPAKGEQGTHRMLSEGRDNDGDGSFNEDGPGGVDFNRNLTFAYPYFQAGAGPHQVSEPEVRGVVDFAFDRPNIFAVLTFSPNDNVRSPWKENRQGRSGRIKTAIAGEDAKALAGVLKEYGKLVPLKGKPEAADGKGSFVHWAYFHYGRWSLGMRGWCVPPVKAEKEPAAEKESEDAGNENQPAKKPDDRGATQRNLLRYFEQQGIAGFAPWEAVEHPDFPGQQVEIGGFHPFATLNPPEAELDKLAAQHLKFLEHVLSARPQLALEALKVERLDARLVRIKTRVRNTGKLPTASAHGATTGHLPRCEIELDLPEGAKLLIDARRRTVPRLDRLGGSSEQTWLVMLPEGDQPLDALTFHVRSPQLTDVTLEVSLP